MKRWWRKSATISAGGCSAGSVSVATCQRPARCGKLTKGRAKAAVATLNDALLTKLVEQGTVKGRRVRSDTTVLPANIVYPTDIALLADGLRVTERHLGRLHKLGGTLGTAVEATVKRMARSRERVKEQLRHLSQQLKQKDRPAGVRQAATK